MFPWNKLSKRFFEAPVYKLFCAQKVLDVKPFLLRDSFDQVEKDTHLIQIWFLSDMLKIQLSPKCEVLTF